jgi:hypothetical protein
VYFAEFRSVAAKSRTVVSMVVVLFFQSSCGPEDYQKPVQQFQDASTVVVNASREFLNNENTVEQNKVLDDLVFERKPLNLPEIDKIEIITPEEIKIRTAALDALSQYTSYLAQLAQGKSGIAVGDNTKKLSDSLKTLADDAKKLPSTKSTFLNNAKFSGVASAAASAIGAVAQLIVEHKARHELERSIVENDSAVRALIQQISDDATLSFERQKNQVGVYGSQLSKDYETELKEKSDPIFLLNFAKTIKTYRTQKLQLSNANPAPAIDKMKKAHEALVAYVVSDKNPKTLAELVTAVQNFVAAAQPLGQAVQALVSAN